MLSYICGGIQKYVLIPISPSVFLGINKIKDIPWRARGVSKMLGQGSDTANYMVFNSVEYILRCNNFILLSNGSIETILLEEGSQSF